MNHASSHMQRFPRNPLIRGLCSLLLVFIACSPLSAQVAIDLEAIKSELINVDITQSARTNAWFAELASLEQEPLSVKLKRVNDFFNRSIQLASDIDTWGENNFWATPIELIENRQGDLQDFALAKLVSLVLLEVPSDQLFLVYTLADGSTSSIRDRRQHTVLLCACSSPNRPLILDSLEPRALDVSRRFDLTPLAALRLSDHSYPAHLRNDPYYSPSPVQRYLAKLHAAGLPTIRDF